MKRRLLFVVVLFILASVFGINTSELFEDDMLLTTDIDQINVSQDVLNAQTQEALVTRVIDGDTIELETGEKVRYIGIDTPETNDPQSKTECFGKEAKEFNRKLVEGRKVRLEKDISDTDRYGRLLRYVYVENIFVNLHIVDQGYAYATSYPPDVYHQTEFLHAQKTARENLLGLWEMCEKY
ncbi:thermonuclease family protein [Candidatus Woesebacteria bacterium]|nr:MAG: thermonuclease family protein [Candidatus Woesebacteria bacterium]